MPHGLKRVNTILLPMYGNNDAPDKQVLKLATIANIILHEFSCVVLFVVNHLGE